LTRALRERLHRVALMEPRSASGLPGQSSSGFEMPSPEGPEPQVDVCPDSSSNERQPRLRSSSDEIALSPTAVVASCGYRARTSRCGNRSFRHHRHADAPHGRVLVEEGGSDGSAESARTRRTPPRPGRSRARGRRRRRTQKRSRTARRGDISAGDPSRGSRAQSRFEGSGRRARRRSPRRSPRACGRSRVCGSERRGRWRNRSSTEARRGRKPWSGVVEAPGGSSSAARRGSRAKPPDLRSGRGPEAGRSRGPRSRARCRRGL